MRVKEKIENIDYNETKQFFKNRAGKFRTDNPYAVTMYQDHNEKLVRERNEKEVQKLKPLLELNEQSRILDIGCGAGFFSIILSQLGHTVHGIDITPNMIDEANQLAESLDCDATFSVMDAENLGFDTNTFDIVVARNVTWNLPHPDKAYAEWFRVIRPGGLILNYDAEHARNHHNVPQSVHHAHEHVSNELKERCHTIYHMLDISSYTRPQWDKELLTKLGASSVTIDLTVGPRIYNEEDEFYIPVPMFLVKAIK